MRIIAFSDYRFVRVLSNWLDAISRLGLLDHVTIIAFDAPTNDEMARRGIRCELRPTPSAARADLVRTRTRVMHEIVVNSDEPIVHSELDAVWMRDPRTLLLIEPADLVFSQGTTWPIDSYEARGFVLCTGLYLVHPNKRTRSFFADLAAGAAKIDSDQLLFNHVIDRYVSTWHVSEPYQIACPLGSFTASAEPIRGLGNALSVSVIPHHQIPRLVEGRVTEDMYVCHPLSGKKASETEAVLREFALWFEESDKV